MNLDIYKALGDKKEKRNETPEIEGISTEEIELAQKLEAIEEFTVERFEEDMVVLENRETQEMINVEKRELPEGIETGDILKKINGKYFIDNEKTQEVSERIKNKMDNLWK